MKAGWSPSTPALGRNASTEPETILQPLLVGLTKKPSSKPAYVEIVGTDGQLAAQLTAYEAEQLAEILRDLAATLRDESQANTRR